mmetsp:Transcript_38528/g.98371  ORF Transcript_38528/g.98371 Transcript_38528/m.98371 type:complete len:698 (-) Transcript_38528:73-2166(-)
MFSAHRAADRRRPLPTKGDNLRGRQQCRSGFAGVGLAAISSTPMLFLRLVVVICFVGGPSYSGRCADRSGRNAGILLAEAFEIMESSKARNMLRDAGAEKAWPAFENDTTLLSLAFSEQAEFPTPVGGLPGAGKIASTSPFVTVFDDFLSAEECDFLRTFALTRLAPAMVVQNGDNWYDTQLQTRNNEQHWLTQVEERKVPLLRHMIKRMHRTSRVPDEHAEALQVGRYNLSTKYEGHLDTDPAHKVGRPATLIIYLNDVGGGGDTLFPVGRGDCSAQWNTDPKTGEKIYGASLCCSTPEKDAPETVRVNPKQGRAVLFFSHKPDGSVDSKSKHIGCPITAGEKWIAQRWFRFEPYNRVSYMSGPGRDDRFDGMPGEATVEARNFRKVSDISPRLFLEENFLTGTELSFLSDLASTQLSSFDALQAWLGPGDIAANPTLQELASRAWGLARLPPHHNHTALRLGRFEGGERQHLDSPPAPEAFEAVQRQSAEAVRGVVGSQPATIVLILAVPDVGGEFAFPRAQATRDSPLCDGNDDAACCASEGIFKVAPRPGDALLIYSHSVDGRVDSHAEHLICPPAAAAKGQLLIAEFAFVFDAFSPTASFTGPSSASPQDVQPVVEFQNMLSIPATIFWVPPAGGEESRMDELPAGPGGEVKPFNSFPGHIFHVRDANGALLKKVVVTNSARQRHKITSEEL